MKAIKLYLTPEQHAQLSQIVINTGNIPERVVTNLVTRYLDQEARFRAAVEQGLPAAARGEFIEEQEMDARVHAMFKG